MGVAIRGNAGYALTPVAVTGGEFVEFGPYVASIDGRGVVAFTAGLVGGGTGVFTGDGGVVTAVVDSRSGGGVGVGVVGEVCSHPDVDGRGRCCFYGVLKSGERGVFVAEGGEIERLANSHGALGPTMNEEGGVAFRADGEGGEGIFVSERGRTMMVARTGEEFGAFQGLPVINSAGAVVFRGDMRAGGQCIRMWDGEKTSTIIETGDEVGSELGELGSFPVLNDAGAVGFVATLRRGGSGVFVVAGGKMEMVVESGGEFESFRGVLINNAYGKGGPLVFYATPVGGTLGVYVGRELLLGIGSGFMGSRVTEFALNPVSMNEVGQLAIRVKLEDGRQAVLRADPEGG